MIKFENVTKIYRKGEVPALKDVTFEIQRGEFVFIVGHTGSGKSTITRLLLRSSRANEGSIHVAGKNLNSLTQWRVHEYRQQIGMVFQEFNLLENKTAYENVAFALQVIGKPRHSIKTLVPEALKIVGLYDKANRFPHQLSGGEQQRVAIARAFVNKPLVLLADEPTGSLDPKTSDEIMQVFDMISQTGTTILMVTHDDKLVNRYKKRVLELDHGMLIRDEYEGGYKPKTISDINVEMIEHANDVNTTYNLGIKQVKSQNPTTGGRTSSSKAKINSPKPKASQDELVTQIMNKPNISAALETDDQILTESTNATDFKHIQNSQIEEKMYEEYFNDSSSLLNTDVFKKEFLNNQEVKNNSVYVPEDDSQESEGAK